MRVLCSSRKPMRKTPVSGFPRALLSLSHAQKRRALGSRLTTAVDGSTILESKLPECSFRDAVFSFSSCLKKSGPICTYGDKFTCDNCHFSKRGFFRLKDLYNTA